jgi:hypothetical protein
MIAIILWFEKETFDVSSDPGHRRSRRRKGATGRKRGAQIAPPLPWRSVMRARCQMVSLRLVVVILGIVTALISPARFIGQELGTLRACDVPNVVKYERIGPERVPTDLNAHSARNEHAMSQSIDYPPFPTRLLADEPTGLTTPSRPSICGESVRNPTRVLGRASPSWAYG